MVYRPTYQKIPEPRLRLTSRYQDILFPVYFLYKSHTQQSVSHGPADNVPKYCISGLSFINIPAYQSYMEQTPLTFKQVNLHVYTHVHIKRVPHERTNTYGVPNINRTWRKHLLLLNRSISNLNTFTGTCTSNACPVNVQNTYQFLYKSLRTQTTLYLKSFPYTITRFSLLGKELSRVLL